MKEEGFTRAKFDALLNDDNDSPTLKALGDAIKDDNTPVNVKNLLNLYNQILKKSTASEEDFQANAQNRLIWQNDFDASDYQWFYNHPQFITALDPNVDNLKNTVEIDGEQVPIGKVLEDVLNKRDNKPYKSKATAYSSSPKRNLPSISKLPKRVNSLEDTYKQLSSIVSSLGYDIKRIREAETREGAERYVTKMNSQYPPDDPRYKLELEDVDDDDIPEIFINKKFYNPATKTYSDFKPYIVNGWKLARKDGIKRLYQQDIQDTLGFGHARSMERRKRKQDGNPYPTSKAQWINNYLYNKTKDPEDPFKWASIKQTGVVDPAMYKKIEANGGKPREKIAARSLFTSIFSEVMKGAYKDNDRTALYDSHGGFIRLASDAYRDLVSGPIEEQLITMYNINDEKELKKYKAKDAYKDQVEEIVKQYLTPEGKAALLSYVQNKPVPQVPRAY